MLQARPRMILYTAGYVASAPCALGPVLYHVSCDLTNAQ